MLNLSCHLQLPINTNKTDCHDITEILLKVALKTLTLTLNSDRHQILYFCKVPSNDYSCTCLDSIKFLVFEKNYVSIFPYGPKSKICLAMVTILDFRSTKKNILRAISENIPTKEQVPQTHTC